MSLKDRAKSRKEKKMNEKKLVRAIRKLAGIADEVIPDETIADSLSYEDVLDLERDVLFHGGPSFKEHFIKVYNKLSQQAKAWKETK